MKDFSDDEFSDNELDMMQFIVDTFGGKTSVELVYYTHRPNSPWYQIAKKTGLFELFEMGVENSSDEKIDFEEFFCNTKDSLMRYREQKQFNILVHHYSS